MDAPTLAIAYKPRKDFRIVTSTGEKSILYILYVFIYYAVMRRDDDEIMMMDCRRC
jgi:hypothetical protein